MFRRENTSAQRSLSGAERATSLGVGALGLSGRVARAYFRLNPGIPFVARGFQIILGLHVDPIIRRRIEVASKAQCGLSGDAPMAGYDTGNSIGRHVKRLGQAVHADAQVVQREQRVFQRTIRNMLRRCGNITPRRSSCCGIPWNSAGQKRDFNRAHIRRLAEFFHVSPELFL